MALRWRLFESYFNGPGEYKFGMGADQLVLSVAADRSFELKEPTKLPISGIAHIIGGKHDSGPPR